MLWPGITSWLRWPVIPFASQTISQVLNIITQYWSLLLSCSKFYNFYIKCDSGILKMKTKPAVTYWVKVPSPRPPLQAVVLAHVKDTLIVAIFIAMVYFLVKWRVWGSYESSHGLLYFILCCVAGISFHGKHNEHGRYR